MLKMFATKKNRNANFEREVRNHERMETKVKRAHAMPSLSINTLKHLSLAGLLANDVTVIVKALKALYTSLSCQPKHDMWACSWAI